MRFISISARGKRATLLLFAYATLQMYGMAQQPKADPCNGCAVAEQFLKDAKAIQPGMTRGQVTEKFVEDGGISMVPTSRYRYKKCMVLKIEVEFELISPRGTSSGDHVKSVSKIYVESPFYD